MINLLLGFLIPLLTILFESYPRFLNRKFGVDIWTHLLYLKEYHRQKGIPKNIENGFLVSGDYDYPPIFILILSKFPLKLVERYEFLFSPFFDSLLILTIFFVSYLLSGNILLALLTQVIYILTPIIVLENSSATPRSLGYTLFSVLYLSLFFYLQTPSILLLSVAIFCGSLIFLSHRFTTQGFLFFSIFFTIIEKNLLFVEVFALSLILAIIFSKGFYLKVLKGHLGNLYFWYKNSKYRFYHQVKGSYKEHKTQDFIFKLYNQFLKFPPFVLAITNPWTLFVFYMALFNIPIDPFLGNLLLVSLLFYSLALLTTWLEPLRFLGEGQRYLELSAFPTAFLSAKVLFSFLGNELFGLVFLTYIVIGGLSLLTIVVIQKKAIINDKLRTVTPSMDKIFKYLRGLRIKPRLLCIPHQITTNTIYHTGCPVFVNANYESIIKISDVYPYIKKPLRKITKEYSLDAILLNEEYAKIKDLKLGKYTEIKRFNNFVLIKPS